MSTSLDSILDAAFQRLPADVQWAITARKVRQRDRDERAVYGARLRASAIPRSIGCDILERARLYQRSRERWASLNTDHQAPQ